MLKNYFKIALRNLLKNKVHSFINLSGLALGMAAATLLLLNIQYGLSIDQFHAKKAKLFGSEDPINKVITTPTGNTFTVTGVLRDLPVNTQFNFECLMSWTLFHSPSSWKNQDVVTYAELAPGANIDAVNGKIASIVTSNNSAYRPAGRQLPGLLPFLL
jgi:hypothetical protein